MHYLAPHLPDAFYVHVPAACSSIAILGLGFVVSVVPQLCVEAWFYWLKHVLYNGWLLLGLLFFQEYVVHWLYIHTAASSKNYWHFSAVAAFRVLAENKYEAQERLNKILRRKQVWV